MNPFKYRWVWCLAEDMDFLDRRPRWFWRWLLVRCDRAHGYNFRYDQ